MAKKKSSLVTPEPYHLPGYCGFVPQLKYTLGSRYGMHTHKLLTDPTLASSGNGVLAHIDATALPPPYKTQEDFFNSPVYNRTRSWGSQKYIPQMVPGYAGFVPKAQHYFGSRYAENCHHAISSFEADQQHQETKLDEIRKGVSADDINTPRPPQLSPLQATAPEAKPYLPAFTKHYSRSPFSLPNDHPQKLFMSGYTGFVPKARKYIGQGYDVITRKALKEHGQECQRLQDSLQQPVTVFLTQVLHKPPSVLYKKGSGLLPRYTGHVPGNRYTYGMTFGKSTNQVIAEAQA